MGSKPYNYRTTMKTVFRYFALPEFQSFSVSFIDMKINTPIGMGFQQRKNILRAHIHSNEEGEKHSRGRGPSPTKQKGRLVGLRLPSKWDFDIGEKYSITAKRTSPKIIEEINTPI